MTRTTRRRLAAGMTAIAAAPAIIGTARAQARTITFGGSIPLSGRAAETGLNVHAGYLAAVKAVKTACGPPAPSTKPPATCSAHGDCSPLPITRIT